MRRKCCSHDKVEAHRKWCQFFGGHPVFRRPRLFAGFSVDEYESQLDAALRPVLDAAKLAVTRTSYVLVAVVLFVVAVHVASGVLRCYFRLTDDVAAAGPRNVYVTPHAPPPLVGAGGDDGGPGGPLTTRLRRPVVADPGGAGETDRGGGEYDSSAGEDDDVARGRDDGGGCGGGDLAGAGEDDQDACSSAVCRRPPATSGGVTPPSTAAQLTLRTTRRTSATASPQSSLDFKYSETKV